MSAELLPSVCPHDCPSVCALEVERLDSGRLGKVKGSQRNPYTAGVICAKVARYAERFHHPERLSQPLRCVGPKGSGEFVPVTWDDALDEVAEAFVRKVQQHGTETVWPYYYAGTMGLVQRDGIERLRHAKKYSGFFGSICTNLAWTGYTMGTGRLLGSDPREMAKSDCVVIWGTNTVVTQVNVMTHAVRATCAPAGQARTLVLPSDCDRPRFRARRDPQLVRPTRRPSGHFGAKTGCTAVAPARLPDGSEARQE